MDNYKMFKLVNGEFIITEVEMDDEGDYLLTYPAVIVPIPPEQAQGMQNQIGFGKFMPFSDHSSDIRMNPKRVLVDSEPDKKLKEAYIQWATQIRSKDSGIIVPGMVPPTGNLKSGQADSQRRPFDKLNV